MTVYILSHFGDVHAHAVHWACEILGKSSVFLDLYEFFESSRIGIIPENGRQRLLIDGIEVDQSASVWLRRPNPPKLFKESSVHASDLKFAEMSCASLYRGFLEGLSECPLVVSPWTGHTAASLKMNQISAAQRVGMKTPRTVFTNDIDLAISRLNQDEWIAKSHSQFKWAPVNGKHTIMPSVAPISPRDLASYSSTFPFSPIIIQEKVKSTDEIRIFVFGRTVFAASLGFSNLDGELDWRRFHSTLDIKLIELPERFRQQIFELMDALGLTSGAFDFILNESNEYVFLEVNSCGQWIWMEIDDSIPILDAFSQFLISGDPRFEYNFSQAPTVLYSDFLNSQVADEVFVQRESATSPTTLARKREGQWFGSMVAVENEELS